MRNRMLFGIKSEKRGAAAEEKKADEQKPPKKGHGPKTQLALPIVEVKHEIPKEKRDCMACGGTLESQKAGGEKCLNAKITTIAIGNLL